MPNSDKNRRIAGIFPRPSEAELEEKRQRFVAKLSEKLAGKKVAGIDSGRYDVEIEFDDGTKLSIDLDGGARLEVNGILLKFE